MNFTGRPPEVRINLLVGRRSTGGLSCVTVGRSIEIEICLRLNRGRTEVRTTRRPNLAQKCRKTAEFTSRPGGLRSRPSSTRDTDPFASDERHSTHRCPQYYSPRRPVRRQSRRSARSGQIDPNWPSGALRPATVTTPISVFARDGHIYPRETGYGTAFAS